MSQNPPTLEDIRAGVLRMLDRLDPEEPIAATVTFVVNPAMETTFVADLETLAAKTRELPGLKIFAIHRHREIEPGPGAPRYLIYEEWHTRRQFRTQWNSDHLAQFQQGVFALVTAPPDLQFYDGSDHFGLEAVETVRPLATGQKRCWDAEGHLVDCSGEGRGVDGAVRAGLPFPDPRYTDHGDGTVTDERTGLVWLKNANAYGEIAWPAALETVKHLGHGQHGLTDGSRPGDWRMPNINELQSLVDLDSDHGPAFPDDHPFDNLEAANYWSSSTVSSAPPLGWYIAFAVAPPVFDLKMNAMRIWPVRGTSNRVARTGQTKCYDVWGQPIPCTGTGQDGEIQAGAPLPDPRFVDHGDGTVGDRLTGLVWLKDGNPFGSLSWGDAVEHCNALASGRHGLADGSRAGDWRLPNIHEMRSLVDYDYFGPALTPGHPFLNVRSSLYWSSTTVASAPNQARFVFLGLGPSVWDHKSVQIGVWPVRDGRGGGSPADRRTAAVIAAS